MTFKILSEGIDKLGTATVIKHSKHVSFTPAYTFFIREVADLIDNKNSLPYTYWEDKDCAIIWAEQDEKVVGILSGMKIVISGFRDKSLEDFITNNGGEISSGVSKNTSILIIKDDSINGTSKVVKAKDLGITIYTVDNFYKKYLIMD
jgi:NAD-dependent DNA ligase